MVFETGSPWLDDLLREFAAKGPDAGPSDVVEGTLFCVRIYGRGEHVLYRQGERCTLLHVCLPGREVTFRRQDVWNDGSRIRESERAEIQRVVARLLRWK